jgi:hypothetical protein
VAVQELGARGISFLSRFQVQGIDLDQLLHERASRSRGQEDQDRNSPPSQERQAWDRFFMGLHRVGSCRVRLLEAVQ